MNKVNSEWLKQYLEYFNSCAGNDGLSYDDVLESDYSPYSSIVNREGLPVLEIGFNMRTSEPFLAWANCGIKQLFVDLPLELPKIVERAIQTEELVRELAVALQGAFDGNPHDDYESWKASGDRVKKALLKAREVLGDE